LIFLEKEHSFAESFDVKTASELMNCTKKVLKKVIHFLFLGSNLP